MGKNILKLIKVKRRIRKLSKKRDALLEELSPINKELYELREQERNLTERLNR